MEYTIDQKGNFRKLIDKAKSRLEDIFLSVLLLLAKFSKSKKLDAWIKRYTEKKTQQLQQELIRLKWDKVTLDKAAAAIRKESH